MKSGNPGSIELICPAGSPAMLRAAVEAGADGVYCGLADSTNARNFPGLNFSPRELADGVAWAHARGAKVLVAVNTFARAGEVDTWRASADAAAAAGADAIIAADLAVLAHVHANHPGARLHLSVQAAASSPESIRFYAQTYGVKRVVLPRVLSVEEIAALTAEIDVETEAFGFGGLCVMAEGRCMLSSYATGKSPNLSGVCSPPSAVAYVEEPGGMAVKVGGFTVDRYHDGESAGYPTLCKGRFEAHGTAGYLFEDPVSLNAMSMLVALRKAGVTAVKIEGRQRGKAYVAQVTAAFRAAIDAMDRGQDPARFAERLMSLSEGGRQTDGAYRKTWR